MRNLSDELIGIAIRAASAGTYPSHGRFYYVAYVDEDGTEDIVDGAMPDYQTLADAVDRAHDHQRMAESTGNKTRVFVVRTRDHGAIVYRALPQRGCVCQRYGKSGVPWPSGKCMVCGELVDWNGAICR